MTDIDDLLDFLPNLLVHAAADPTVIGDDIQVGDITTLTIFLSLHDFGTGGGETEGKIADHAYTG